MFTFCYAIATYHNYILFSSSVASLTSLATASAACIGMDWSLRSMYAHDGYVLVALLALSYISEFPVLATFVYMLGKYDWYRVYACAVNKINCMTCTVN